MEKIDYAPQKLLATFVWAHRSRLHIHPSLRLIPLHRQELPFVARRLSQGLYHQATGRL